VNATLSLPWPQGANINEAAMLDSLLNSKMLRE
jgi:hypothetical protein